MYLLPCYDVCYCKLGQTRPLGQKRAFFSDKSKWWAGWGRYPIRYFHWRPFSAVIRSAKLRLGCFEEARPEWPTAGCAGARRWPVDLCAPAALTASCAWLPWLATGPLRRKGSSFYRYSVRYCFAITVTWLTAGYVQSQLSRCPTRRRLRLNLCSSWYPVSEISNQTSLSMPVLSRGSVILA